MCVKISAGSVISVPVFFDEMIGCKNVLFELVRKIARDFDSLEARNENTQY